MENIIIIDLETNKEIGTIEEVRSFLKLEHVRRKAFNRFFNYYQKHGWYGGFNSDLYTINLQAK